jgi:hypothetical protein
MGTPTSLGSNSNTNTNYSERNTNVSSNSNSGLEVVFAKKMTVKPKVRFATRRAVRKTDKTPEAVEARKKSYKKKGQRPFITKNMNAEEVRIHKEADKRTKLNKTQRQERTWQYLDYLKLMKEVGGEDFLTEEQRDFIETELLGR